MIETTKVERLSVAIERPLTRMVEGGVPGAFVFVQDPDGPSIFRSAGAGNLADRRPIGEFDHYRIGSTSKTFAAVVALQLASEGRLRLLDRVVDWLPEFAWTCDPSLTIEHLLRMRSGLFDFEDHPDPSPGTRGPDLQIARSARHVVPGSR